MHAKRSTTQLRIHATEGTRPEFRLVPTLTAWYRHVKTADWARPADVKRDMRSASILRDGRAIFNIAGNKYRIVVCINYPYRVVYIRFVGRMSKTMDPAQTV
ncbi:MAG: type II toxin-antitoxin system HigB family toxin [Methylobacteriaceae bacterium]|nr:type II toxin-antitoxin system HigB family toxin [Methylobacteriaceae bacterium]